MEFRFNVTGAERKSLAGAINEILNAPMKYLGAPGFGYEVGGYTVDKEGTVSGERNDALLDALTERGFAFEANAEIPVAEKPEKIKTPEEPDHVVIEIPADGFTLEKLDNLAKLVASKAALIKTALGTDELAIISTDETLRFPWFSGGLDGDTVSAYTQFIAALCKTAKEKKRITAKVQDEFENPRFTMRVWLIGLGMVGDDYKLVRKLLLQNLTGNAAWRYGAPDKKTATDTGADADEKAGADHE